ncbi:MAG: O-linked N-acetylglucosamine transferase, SPINDLY family protein [Usitatibacter sp.]
MGAGPPAGRMSEEALKLARDRHREGRLADAIAAYAGILGASPERGDVWHLKAMAEHQAGLLDAAWESVSRAIRERGDDPATHLLAGMVLQDRRDLAAAEQSFARAAVLKPGWAAPLANRGQALIDLGRTEEALGVLRAAADLDPSNARIWNNIGLALLSLDRIEEGRATFVHALTLAPSLPGAHFNLARIYNLRSDLNRAFEHAQAAARSDPRLTDAHLLLGDLYRKARDASGMRRSFSDAVRSAPGSARARNAYAEFLASVGETREGREEYRRIAADNPSDLKAALGASLLLPVVYRGSADLEAWRGDYEEGLARLASQAGRFELRSPREAMQQSRWTNFYLAYQGRDDRALQERFGDFMHEVLGRAVPQWMRPREPVAGRGRMRIGFCSHFFFNCTVGRYFSSWATRLDRSRFETFVYYTNEWVADDTRAIAAAVDSFRHLPGRSFDVVASHILADDLDALVFPELGMHGETFSLASLRLAPVQVAGWGHPTTTGLPNMDYFVSSREMEPAGAQEQYRERLVLLPGLGTHYATPAAAHASERAAFGLPADATLYLVPQSLFKIHPDNDALLAGVIARDPRGRLVFFDAPYDAVNAVFKARLGEALAARGLRLEDRVIFLKYMAHADYLRVNASCDVMLDTVHWSGGNTSLDAIASGLPMVTLPGTLMRGRQSAAMLGLLGLDELVAADADAYAGTAIAVANDPSRRASLSARIREARPSLFERDEPIRELEDFLERSILERRVS